MSEVKDEKYAVIDEEEIWYAVFKENEIHKG